MTNRKIAYNLCREWSTQIDMSSTGGYMGAKYFLKFDPGILDMSSASVYMGAKYVQKSGLIFLTCPQLVGTWVQKIFRNLVSYV